MSCHFTAYSVHFVKRPGAVLDQGSVVAKLELDDPTRVNKVKLFIIRILTLWTLYLIVGLLRVIFPTRELCKCSINKRG